MTLELHHVGRNFGTQWAVRGVTTVINEGTSVAVLGANGAGKSTLLRCIAGWLPLAEGRISIDDHTLRPSSAAVRRRLMLLDEPRKHEGSAIEAIVQTVDDYQVDRAGIESEVADWFEQLDLVGIYGKTASAISKGQQYKVAMIGLFVVRPSIWLLDEPFSAGLDAGGLDLLEREMRAHARDGGIVMFSSQWPAHANRLADEAIVLHEGALVCRQASSTPVAAELIAAAPPSLSAVLAGLGES